MKSLGLNEFSDRQTSLDILKAGSKWVGSWADFWPATIKSADKALDPLVTTREFRSRMEDINTTNAFAAGAVLQGQEADDTTGSKANKGYRQQKKLPKEERPCLCGVIHLWKNCGYFRKACRDSNWVGDENVKKEIRTKLGQSYNLYNAIMNRVRPDTDIFHGVKKPELTEKNGDNDNSRGKQGGDRPYISIGNLAVTINDRDDVTHTGAIPDDSTNHRPYFDISDNDGAYSQADDYADEFEHLMECRKAGFMYSFTEAREQPDFTLVKPFECQDPVTLKDEVIELPDIVPPEADIVDVDDAEGNASTVNLTVKDDGEVNHKPHIVYAYESVIVANMGLRARLFDMVLYDSGCTDRITHKKEWLKTSKRHRMEAIYSLWVECSISLPLV